MTIKTNIKEVASCEVSLNFKELPDIA